MIKKIYIFCFLFCAGTITISFNACQKFESINDNESFSSFNSAGEVKFIGTDISNSLKSKLTSLSDSKTKSELVLKDYLDEVENIFTNYYDRNINYALVEIDGRSLMTDYDNFIFRRKLFAFVFEDTPSTALAFLAFSPLSDEFELIIWDDFTKRYEFLIVDNVYHKKEKQLLKVKFSSRSTCIMCHQNGGAIFARAPWGETHFLKNTAEQFAIGDTLATTKNPDLVRFLNTNIKLNVDQKEVETTRSIVIKSFESTIEQFDTSVRKTSNIVLTQKLLGDFCKMTDQECKKNVLSYLAGASNTLLRQPSRNTSESLRTSIIPDVVPAENTGVLISGRTIREGQNINEEFLSTFTLDPLKFVGLRFTQISGLNSILATGQPNPLLPSTLRPPSDTLTESEMMESLRRNPDLMLISFGFNQNDLAKIGDGEQVQNFLLFLSRVNHWPYNRKIYKKYLQRFFTGSQKIDRETLPISYYSFEDSLTTSGGATNSGQEIDESISNQNHVVLIRTCQNCHGAGSSSPINFYDLNTLKNYRVKNSSFGNSLIDSIEKGTMPPKNTDIDTSQFFEDKSKIINFLNSL